MNRAAFYPLLRTLQRVAAVYGLMLAIVLLTPFADWVAVPLFTPADASRGDAIVVLAAWARVQGELNESGLRRTIAAARLYRAGLAPAVVVTGSRPTAADEGDVLALSTQLLGELGVPAAALIVEDESHNTHESAVNVARLAAARGWSRLVLVTDATHMCRARAAFAHEHLSVSTEPTMRWRTGGQGSRLSLLAAVLHEYGGLAYYRARGWI